MKASREFPIHLHQSDQMNHNIMIALYAELSKEQRPVLAVLLKTTSVKPSPDLQLTELNLRIK
jgi:hypothetical protein